MNLFQVVDTAEHNALHRAVRDNNLESVKYLLRKGVSVANTINEGQTPLYIAISKNYHDVVEELCKNKSRDDLRRLINRQTLDTGRTVLHAAAEANSLRGLRFLLSLGAKFEARDRLYRLPKQLAGDEDEDIRDLFETIEELFDSAYKDKIILDKLKQQPIEDHAALVYARNYENLTALQVGLSKNHLDTVAKIIHFRIENLKQDDWRTGGNFDEPARLSESTRLHLSDLSAMETNLENKVVDLLQDAREFLELCREDRDPSFENQPALIVIEESLEFFGSKSVENKRLDLLLKNQVAFVIETFKLCIVAPMVLFMRRVYTSELLAAAARNDLVSVEKCLTGHPDLNEEDVNGRTALHYAFMHKNYEMAKLLLTLGADTATGQNEPLLYFALRHMNESSHSVDARLMQLLFDHAGDDEKSINFVNAKNNADGGETALHWAVRHTDDRLTQFILSKGAIYCAQDSRKCTPKDFCVKGGRQKSLYCVMERLFAYASYGQTKELVQTMEKLSVFNLLAVGGARNELRQTLLQVVEAKGHVEEAEQIRKLLSSDKCDRLKRSVVEFLCDGLENVVYRGPVSGINFRRY